MARTRDVRVALERLINDQLAPIARRYNYTPQSLNLRTSWKPVVLIIGNYSSGKSTLINEMLGGSVQRTGQAPTDDCFTIITAPDEEVSSPVRVIEEVPGSTVVNDPALPFTGFKKFGNRFMAHILLKKVNSPCLRNLAIIDSPGMLDSVAELDRGYDYQEVLGRLAELADLVVLVFDPHRAGTIKETYISIRSTLPRSTSEDRVVFVMNRIDECKNIADLLRCYGVLCWNLSQMTGRKDIPRVYLTYSPTLGQPDAAIRELADERVELVEKMEQAPKLQVSHWLGAVDNHLHKVEVMARTLANAARRYRAGVWGYLQLAIPASIAGALVVDTLLAGFLIGKWSRGSMGRLFNGEFLDWPVLILLLLFVLAGVGVYYHFRRVFLPAFHRDLLDNLDQNAPLDTRYARDLWDNVRPMVAELAADTKQLGPLAPHHSNVQRLRRLIDQEIRELYELHLGHAPPSESEAEDLSRLASPPHPEKPTSST